MTDKELRHLSRVELIRLLLEQTQESERLRQELEQTKQALNDRCILISQAGSIAEASLKINRVMEIAQEAADQYLENVKRKCQESAREQELGTTKKKQCAQMLEETQGKADEYGRDR